MKRLITIIMLVGLLHGCSSLMTGPRNPYNYPAPPIHPQVTYAYPEDAGTKDICVAPSDMKEVLKHQIAWEVTYKKMKLIIDEVNKER